ncbi:hypothetical protein B0H67DRAFT_644322 [Lasiosphaeris hirsuta]|uniref:Uncharacterized protein n=1 Tax=Lasiosphaeris hirsuta TaxID=260670 RepID=A0AA40ASI0_9PEZI|nr:hypothetical protein B0H67DRAFT_644322 [Lasiosphaeris hirsuta]
MAHRNAVLHHYFYEPNIRDLDQLTVDMTLEQADHCCNKSVAVYVLMAKNSFLAEHPLLEMIHIYLYDKWVRPSRSSLEYGQFLAKTIVPEAPSLPTGAKPSDVVDIVVVETMLETAVSFVMNLKEREVAAFGLQPDPVASTKGLEDG